MKTKKMRFLAALLAAVMCFSLLFGCSNTEENPSGDAAVPQASQAPKDEGAAEDEAASDEDAIIEQSMERLGSPWADAEIFLDGDSLGVQKSGDVFRVEALPGQVLSAEVILHDDMDIVEEAFDLEGYEFEFWTLLIPENEDIALQIESAQKIEFLNPGEVTVELAYGDQRGISEHSMTIECVVNDPAEAFAEMKAGRNLLDLNDDGRMLALSDGNILISYIGEKNDLMLYDTYEGLADSPVKKVKMENFDKKGYSELSNFNEYNGEIYYVRDREIRKINSDMSGYDVVYSDEDLRFDLFFVLGDDFYCYGKEGNNSGNGSLMRISPEGEVEVRIDSVIFAQNFAYDGGKLYFTARTSVKRDAPFADYCLDLATMTVKQLNTSHIAEIRNYMFADGMIHGINSHFNTYDIIDLKTGEIVTSIRTPESYCDAGFYEGKMYFLYYSDKIDGPAALISYDAEAESFTTVYKWNIGRCRGVPSLYYSDGRLYVSSQTYNYDSLHYLVYDIASETATVWH